MEDADRRKIRTNCDKLVKEINWPNIWPKLLEHGIYLPEDQNVQRWEKDLNNIDNNREIYLGIMKRGPKAFGNFLQCLNKIGRNDLVNILEPDNSFDQVDNNHTNDIISEINGNNNLDKSEDTIKSKSTDDYYKILQSTQTPLKIHVKKSTKFQHRGSEKVPCYVMQSNPRGLVLIINNTSFNGLEEDRSAAQHDEHNLEELFKQMGFKVQIARDLERQGMLDVIGKFSKQPELRHVHSTFVIVMSHGNQLVKDHYSHSIICGVDNDSITDTEVLDFFTTSNCENMYNKPKVFIFQTCRGKKVQEAVNASNVSMERDETDVNPIVSPTQSPVPPLARNQSDVMVAYSTLSGHSAHRDIFTGSWYIQTLCEVMMNHAHDTELYDMLQMADQRLSRMQSGSNGCQTSTSWSLGFNKKCYLNPGYFGD